LGILHKQSLVGHEIVSFWLTILYSVLCQKNVAFCNNKTQDFHMYEYIFTGDVMFSPGWVEWKWM